MKARKRLDCRLRPEPDLRDRGYRSDGVVDVVHGGQIHIYELLFPVNTHDDPAAAAAQLQHIGDGIVSIYFFSSSSRFFVISYLWYLAPKAMKTGSVPKL